MLEVNRSYEAKYKHLWIKHIFHSTFPNLNFPLNTWILNFCALDPVYTDWSTFHWGNFVLILMKCLNLLVYIFLEKFQPKIFIYWLNFITRKISLIECVLWSQSITMNCLCVDSISTIYSLGPGSPATA